MLRAPLLAAVCLIASVAARAADYAGPIFDAHLHYNTEVWDHYDPAAAQKNLRDAGVRRALVTSWPDEGSLKLHAANPKMFVPMLRPYRGRVTRGDWFRHDEVPAFMAERLSSGIYAGAGEVHLFSPDDAKTPVARAVLEHAVKMGLFIYVHCDAPTLETILGYVPQAKVLWAHAGFSEGPAAVGRILDAHKQVWTETSYRAQDIAPGGALGADWAALFTRHADRFLIGADVTPVSRWNAYGRIIGEHRRWLGQLPPDVARQIAWQNAARLFGGAELISE